MPSTTIQPSAAAGKDTYINQASPTFNYGVSTTLVTNGGGGGAAKRAYVQFDLSSLPANAIINSAILTITYVSGAGGNPAINFYRSTTAWFEGSQNGAAPTAGQDGSTWNLRNANGSVAWSGGAGGDLSASIGVISSGSFVAGANNFTITSQVQSIVDGALVNNGWVWDTTGSGDYNWASSDNATAANRPKLVIDYSHGIEGSSAGTSSAKGILKSFSEIATTLQPDATAGKDTYINNGNSNSNDGARNELRVGSSSGLAQHKSLIQFDLSSIPADAAVRAAFLSLYVLSEINTSDLDMTLRRGFVQWFEGNKIDAAPGVGEDGSVWNYKNFNGLVSWGAAGGLAGTDYALVGDATDTATVTGPNQWVDWEVTSDIVAFLDGTFTNYGWWILPTAFSGGNQKTFASSDHTTAEFRPKLILIYTVESLEGTSTGTAIVEGTMHASGTLQGSASGSSNVEGTMISNQNILASAAGTSTATAFLGARVYVHGVSFGDSTTIANIKASYHSVGSSAGTSLHVANIKGIFRMQGLAAGSGLLTAVPSFEGQLRGRADGTSDAFAVGYARAKSVAVQVGCNPVPLFYLTDGATKTNGQLNILNFLSETNGYLLKVYRPGIAQYKDGGRWSSSPQAQGRRFKGRTFDNVIDIIEVAAHAPDQDALIQFQQELIAFQEAAADYWASEYPLLPQYIVSRAARETNTRYAVIHMISCPELENPYAPPFFDDQGATFENLTIRIERGLWLSTPPGKFECVEISSRQEWTVSGWQTGS